MTRPVVWPSIIEPPKYVSSAKYRCCDCGVEVCKSVKRCRRCSVRNSRALLAARRAAK